MSDDAFVIRLERLESLVALQDRTIEELNDALAGQQQQLDLLEQQVTGLARALKRVRDSQEQEPIENVPPPHYNG